MHRWLWSVWGHSIGLLKRLYSTIQSFRKNSPANTFLLCLMFVCAVQYKCIVYTNTAHVYCRVYVRVCIIYSFLFREWLSLLCWMLNECWLSAQNLINCTSRSSQHSVGFTDSTGGREPSLSSAEISGLHRKQQFLDGHKRMMKLLEAPSVG